MTQTDLFIGCSFVRVHTLFIRCRVGVRVRDRNRHWDRDWDRVRVKVRGLMWRVHFGLLIWFLGGFSFDCLFV